VFVIIAGGIAFYDDSVTFRDPLTILAALSGIALLGMIVGAIFGLGELVIPSLHLAEVVVARIMFFFSGALYYANLIPTQIRRWALLNPLLHLIEFVRSGYFANYDSRYVNWHYPITFIVLGLAFIMLLLHRTRRYMVAAG
jgi:capsular polysaccharide transport system permease protein